MLPQLQETIDTGGESIRIGAGSQRHREHAATVDRPEVARADHTGSRPSDEV